MQAMDVNESGAIKVTQFLAAACDKRCSGACSIKDKAALLQCTVNGSVNLAALMDLLTDLGLAFSAEAVMWRMTAARLAVKDGQLKLEDLEVAIGRSFLS